MGFQQNNTTTERRKRNIGEYSTQELREAIGGFEKEYQKNCTGKRVHNEILGHTYAGIIQFAVEYGAVVCSESGVWKIRLPHYERWELSRRAMSELQGRREYAQRMELKELDKQAPKIKKSNAVKTS